MDPKGLLVATGLVCFSAAFLSGGWPLIRQPEPRAAKARAAGLPVNDLFVRASGVAMIALALSVVFVPAVRAAAAVLLALELVPITYSGHRFWTLEPGPQRNGQRIEFFKNLSLFGAALAIAGYST